MKTEHIFIPQFNPVVGRMQWKDVDPDYEFNQEIARSGYGDMLHDSDRNHKYRLAIEHTIKRLKQQYPQNPVHVLDIGTGTGLLSMMAVNAGADLVTACESFIPMATCALNILRNNGFSDKINIIPKRSTDLIVGVDMPCKANVLVAELFDTELIGEGALETYRHAAEHLLTLDASLIPCAAQVYLQVVESQFLWSHHRLLPFQYKIGDTTIDIKEFQHAEIESCSGLPSTFDIQVSEIQLEDSQLISCDRQLRCLLKSPRLVKRFNFGPPADLIKLNDVLDLECTTFESGTAHAFIVWWSLQMESTNSVPPISVAPTWAGDPNSSWRDHWMQAVYFPKIAHYLIKNESFMVRYLHDSLSMRFDILPVPNFNAKPDTSSLDVRNEMSCLSCSCDLHRVWPRTRISELNSSDYKTFSTKIINSLITVSQKYPTSLFNVLVVSDCTYLPFLLGKSLAKHAKQFQLVHLDTSPSSCLLLDRIYKSFSSSRAIIESCQSIEEVFSRMTPNMFTKTNPTESTLILISEPYISSSILPWDSLYFWYAFQNLLSQNPAYSSLYLFSPVRLRIYAILVDFKNLWRIRSPVGFTCESFDLRPFDDLVLDASAKSDELIEPHPLWEYPNTARSDACVIFDMVLPNSSDLGSDFQFADSKKLIHCKQNTLTTSSSSVNGIALWCEWLYNTPATHHSNETWWYAPAGPNKITTLNEPISWKSRGTQQGVFLFPSEWKAKISSNDLLRISACMDFDISTGVLSPSFEII
ncbi:unnamed protein product [Schistosoma intercalatum]|nr:unnamed protein product [Schistosoma intercalatum]CAH8637919.1 unnamed protein product [Schistosoma intercalatum]